MAIKSSFGLCEYLYVSLGCFTTIAGEINLPGNVTVRVVIVLVPLFLLVNPMSSGSLVAENGNERIVNRDNYHVPPYLEVGDILFCEWKYYNADPGWDHVALYIGDDRFIEATAAGNGVVRVIDLDWLMGFTKAICYGQVKTANTSQRRGAVAFAQSQLGKPYQYLDFCKPLLNRSKNPSPTSQAWYCTELVWAAYYNQGINLDLKGVLWGPVMPSEMCWDNDVEMYTWHRLNRWHLGMYAEWILYQLKLLLFIKF